MKVFLPELVRTNGALDISTLPNNLKTVCISVTGQDGSGKTSLRDGLAQYFSDMGNVVVTAKSPCDKYLVQLLNNAISQNGYEDWYTEQMLFSFTDGLLSNYMVQLYGHCDFFICQRGPVDQYAHGVTRSRKEYKEIYQIQRPERLAKFDMYIHMNCDAEVAWDRVCEDEGKDRYEYPDYFARQVKNTEKLYNDIISGNQKELDFLRKSENIYIDTTTMTIPEVLDFALEKVNAFIKNT